MPGEPPVTSDFASFYRRTLAPLQRYLIRFTGGSHPEAQDIAHDAYARVYPQMQNREIEQPKAFLYTTARHLALDRLKHQTSIPGLPGPLARPPSRPRRAWSRSSWPVRNGR